jgi:malate dehydrogenase
LKGEYGLKDLFLGVNCRLGCQGVEQIVELDLDPEEKDALYAAAEIVRQNIDRAKTLVSC